MCAILCVLYTYSVCMRGLTMWRASRCVHSGHSFFSPTPTLHSQKLTSRKNTASICRAAHLHTNHFFHKNVCKNCAILEGMLGIRSRKKEEAIPSPTKGKYAARVFPPPRYFSPLCPNLKLRPEIPMQHFLPLPATSLSSKLRRISFLVSIAQKHFCVMMDSHFFIGSRLRNSECCRVLGFLGQKNTL